MKKLCFLFRVSVAVLSLSLGNNLSAAGCPSIAIDGNNQMIYVWHEPEEKTSFLRILAIYGESYSPIPLTDSSQFQACCPVLATSRMKGAQTTAICVWIATDLIKFTQSIQYALASSSGWSKISGKPIYLNEKEIPQMGYTVDISEDGSVININWLSSAADSTKLIEHHAQSSDSGNSWKIY